MVYFSSRKWTLFQLLYTENEYNKVFWNEGWALNKGRVYEHLCYDCLPKKKRNFIDKMKSKGF